MNKISKKFPKITSFGMVLVLMAILLIFTFYWWVNAKSIGNEIGSDTGSSVGKAVGSFLGMTDGKKKGEQAGRDAGLITVKNCAMPSAQENRHTDAMSSTAAS